MYDDDDDDAELAALVPRKANKWIYLTIGAELVKRITHCVELALDDITTVFSQRYNYEQDRFEWAAETGADIENIDKFLKEEENARTS